MQSEKEYLLVKANEYISSLKNYGYKVDCFSTKGGGKATLDCDIAIDIKGKHDFAVWPNCEVEFNPYKVNELSERYNITRLKFNEISLNDLAEDMLNFYNSNLPLDVEETKEYFKEKLYLSEQIKSMIYNEAIKLQVRNLEDETLTLMGR